MASVGQNHVTKVPPDNPMKTATGNSPANDQSFPIHEPQVTTMLNSISKTTIDPLVLPSPEQETPLVTSKTAAESQTTLERYPQRVKLLVTVQPCADSRYSLPPPESWSSQFISKIKRMSTVEIVEIPTPPPSSPENSASASGRSKSSDSIQLLIQYPVCQHTGKIINYPAEDVPCLHESQAKAAPCDICFTTAVGNKINYDDDSNDFESEMATCSEDRRRPESALLEETSTALTSKSQAQYEKQTEPDVSDHTKKMAEILKSLQSKQFGALDNKTMNSKDSGHYQNSKNPGATRKTKTIQDVLTRIQNSGSKTAAPKTEEDDKSQVTQGSILKMLLNSDEKVFLGTYPNLTEKPKTSIFPPRFQPYASRTWRNMDPKSRRHPRLEMVDPDVNHFLSSIDPELLQQVMQIATIFGPQDPEEMKPEVSQVVAEQQKVIDSRKESIKPVAKESIVPHNSKTSIVEVQSTKTIPEAVTSVAKTVDDPSLTSQSSKRSTSEPQSGSDVGQQLKPLVRSHKTESPKVIAPVNKAKELELQTAPTSKTSKTQSESLQKPDNHSQPTTSTIIDGQSSKKTESSEIHSLETKTSTESQPLVQINTAVNPSPPVRRERRRIPRIFNLEDETNGPILETMTVKSVITQMMKTRGSSDIPNIRDQINFDQVRIHRRRQLQKDLNASSLQASLQQLVDREPKEEPIGQKRELSKAPKTSGTSGTFKIVTKIVNVPNTVDVQKRKHEINSNVMKLLNGASQEMKNQESQMVSNTNKSSGSPNVPEGIPHQVVKTQNTIPQQTVTSKYLVVQKGTKRPLCETSGKIPTVQSAVKKRISRQLKYVTVVPSNTLSTSSNEEGKNKQLGEKPKPVTTINRADNAEQTLSSVHQTTESVQTLSSEHSPQNPNRQRVMKTSEIISNTPSEKMAASNNAVLDMTQINEPFQNSKVHHPSPVDVVINDVIENSKNPQLVNQNGATSLSALSPALENSIDFREDTVKSIFLEELEEHHRKLAEERAAAKALEMQNLLDVEKSVIVNQTESRKHYNPSTSDDSRKSNKPQFPTSSQPSTSSKTMEPEGQMKHDDREQINSTAKVQPCVKPAINRSTHQRAPKNQRKRKPSPIINDVKDEIKEELDDGTYETFDIASLVKMGVRSKTLQNKNVSDFLKTNTIVKKQPSHVSNKETSDVQFIKELLNNRMAESHAKTTNALAAFDLANGQNGQKSVQFTSKALVKRTVPHNVKNHESQPSLPDDGKSDEFLAFKRPQTPIAQTSSTSKSVKSGIIPNLEPSKAFKTATPSMPIRNHVNLNIPPNRKPQPKPISLTTKDALYQHIKNQLLLKPPQSSSSAEINEELKKDPLDGPRLGLRVPTAEPPENVPVRRKIYRIRRNQYVPKTSEHGPVIGEPIVPPPQNNLVHDRSNPEVQYVETIKQNPARILPRILRKPQLKKGPVSENGRQIENENGKPVYPVKQVTVKRGVGVPQQINNYETRKRYWSSVPSQQPRQNGSNPIASSSNSMPPRVIYPNSKNQRTHANVEPSESSEMPNVPSHGIPDEGRVTSPDCMIIGEVKTSHEETPLHRKRTRKNRNQDDDDSLGNLGIIANMKSFWEMPQLDGSMEPKIEDEVSDDDEGWGLAKQARLET